MLLFVKLPILFRHIKDILAEDIFTEELTRLNNEIVWYRIKIASIVLVMSYVFYLYFDFIALKDVLDSIFKFTLVCIHSAGFILSLVFLSFQRLIRNRKRSINPKLLSAIAHFYIFGYVFLGALASINSQRLTGNIDAYVIILITVAVLFPVNIKYLFFILLINHSFFLIGLSILEKSKYSLLSKQVNSTAAVVFAVLIATTFFFYRKKDFYNNKKLKENERNFRKIFEVNPYPMLLTSVRDGKAILINEKAKFFFNSITDSLEKFGASHLYKDLSERDILAKELGDSGCVKNYTLNLKDSKGSNVWVLLNCELVVYKNENCILTGITDITHLKKMENELLKHASTDTLTGIFNRRYGMELLQHELEKAQKQNLKLTVCFIDVNKLKYVNDVYGHFEGDCLIQLTCLAINKAIENDDILFRYGGDEFVLAFLNKDISNINNIWNNIMKEINKTNQTIDKPYFISISRGMFHYKSGMNITLEEIIKFADMEMYKDKNKIVTK